MEREIKTIEEALSLLGEWVSAYGALESELIRLDDAWYRKCDALELENYRLYALHCNTLLADAANAQIESECPF